MAIVSTVNDPKGVRRKAESHPIPASKDGGPRESLCYRCGEKGHFCRECSSENRRRSDGGAGTEVEKDPPPPPMQVPIQQMGIAEDLGSGINPPVKVGRRAHADPR